MSRRRSSSPSSWIRFPLDSTAKRSPALRVSWMTSRRSNPACRIRAWGSAKITSKRRRRPSAGFIVPVTKEAIFFDRTNLVLSRATEVGEILGLNKEKRLLDLLIGTTNTYNWKGTTYDTYQTATPWVNVLSGNELVDWTSVDASEQLFANMLDPNTGEPILVQAKTMLVSPAYMHQAARILHATDVQTVDNRANPQTIRSSYANPLSGYEFYSSRLMYRRIMASGVSVDNAKQWWFHGDFRRAFAYMENWPITVTQAPLNSEADFNQDILVRFKASERGAAAVMNPRYVVKNYNT